MPKPIFSVDYTTGSTTASSRYGSGTGTHTAQLAYRTAKINQGVGVFGKVDGSTADAILFTRGSQIYGKWYQNINPTQGTIRALICPYWNGNDGLRHDIFIEATGYYSINKSAASNLNFSTYNGVSVSVNVASWTAGTWYDIVVRWDSKNYLSGGTASKYIQMWVNGIEVATSGTATTPTTPSASGYYIGQYAGTNNYALNGIIDEVAICTKPIDTASVTLLAGRWTGTYVSMSTIIEPECLAFLWNADGSGAVSGTSAACTGGTLWLDGYTDIATNPTFDANTTGWGNETGTTVSWNNHADRIYAGTGSAAVRSSGTSGKGIIMSPAISNTTSNKIVLSAWVYSPASATGKDCRLFLIDNLGQTLAATSTVTLVSDTWTQLTLTFQLTGTQTTIRHNLIINTMASGDTFYVDNCSMKIAGNPIPNGHMQDTTRLTTTAGAQLVTNGTFEGGDTTGWTGYLGSVLTVETQTVVVPTKVMKCVRGSNNIVATQSISTTTGKTYIAKAYGKLGTGVSSGYLVVTNVSGIVSSSFTSSWAEYQCIWQAPTSNSIIGIRSGTTGNDSVYVDSIRVYELQTRPDNWTAIQRWTATADTVVGTDTLLTASTANILYDVYSQEIKTADVAGTPRQGMWSDSMNVTGGTNYVLAGNIKGSSGDTVTVEVVAWISTNGTASIRDSNVIASYNVISTSWTRFDTLIKIPSYCNEARVAIFGDSSGSDFFATHFILMTNLVQNPSFETAGAGGADVFANWDETASTGRIADTSSAYSGTHALVLQQSGSGNDMWVKQATLTAGSFYYLRVFAKVGTSGSIRFGNGTAGYYFNYTVTTSYAKYFNTFKAYDTYFLLERGGNSASQILVFDDAVNVALGSVTLTITPATLANSFESGYGLRMDGDALTYPVAGNLSTTKGTIVCEFIPIYSYNDLASSSYFSAYSNALNYLYFYYHNSSDKFVWEYNAGGIARYISSDVFLSNIEFQRVQQLVITYNFPASTFSIYRNGTLKEIGTLSAGSLITLPTTMNLGTCIGSTFPTVSWFRKIRIYNKALTQQQVRNLR
jgi:hypothetical protein